MEQSMQAEIENNVIYNMDKEITQEVNSKKEEVGNIWTPKKEMCSNDESELKTPEKSETSSSKNVTSEKLVRNIINNMENDTPEKITPKEEDEENILTPKKETNRIESNNFKTPEKAQTTPAKHEKMEQVTPEKLTKNIINNLENQTSKNITPKKEEIGNILTPKKKSNISNDVNDFKTPEKSLKFKSEWSEGKVDENKTPQKISGNIDLETDQKSESQCDGEEGMISTTEQARLLIAASKTPSKSIHRTPVKQNTPNCKRSLESSPITPGKYRRVELITLASPKAKRLKQI